MSIEPSDERRECAAHVLVDPGTDLAASTILLPDDVEHHLRRVLRLRDGVAVSVTDGGGNWRIGRVSSSSDSLVLDCDGEVRCEERSAPFTLASAIPKGDRVDWLVQKSTELGVDRILLMDAEYSVVRWKPDRAAKHLVRLQRIADEATRQSRRVWRTLVSGPVPALEVLSEAAMAEPGGTPIRGDEEIIAVGPEGGWSSSETALSSRRVGLGANILRVETAGVAATALRMVAHHATGAFPSSRK